MNTNDLYPVGTEEKRINSQGGISERKKPPVPPKNPNAYLYIINGTAINTDTDETMVIYTALYAPFKTYARPLKEFYSLVDKEKYPWIKQKERFKKYQAE